MRIKEMVKIKKEAKIEIDIWDDLLSEIPKNEFQNIFFIMVEYIDAGEIAAGLIDKNQKKAQEILKKLDDLL